MNISPLDIRKHEFRKSMRGFDPDEVVAFLDVASIEFENLIRENSVLKERVGNLDIQLKKYRDIESTLQETLLSAQRAREETINVAKKQAELIIREAEVKAASIIEEGRNDLSSLRSTFTELKIHKDSFLVKLKALISAQLEMLEEITFPEEEMLNKIDSDSDSENSVPSLAASPESANANSKDFSENNAIIKGGENGEEFSQ